MIKADVLVLHNSVDDAMSGKSGVVFAESNAGVMDQVNAVAAALKKLKIKHKVEAIGTLSQLPELLSRNKQEIIFNLVEELPENMLGACYVPAICRSHGRSCTGNDTPALLLALNKWQTKAILKAFGIPTPDGTVVPIGGKVPSNSLMPGKYFVKPVFSDASEGIDIDSIVDFPSAKMNKAVKRIHEEIKQPAIVEKFIPNREFNISVLPMSDGVEVLSVAEIDFSAFGADAPRIVDYSAKWQSDSFGFNNTPRIIPADLPKKVAKLIHQYSLAAYNAVGCSGYSRVDFRMDDNYQPFVLEVNPNPDISPDAGFAAALAVAGISYEKFVQDSLTAALRSVSH